MTLLAAETASTNPLLPSWPEFIIGTILFVLVFGALAKFLLPRAQQTLAQRTEMIEGGLARSEEAQAEAKQLLDQYHQQLAEARHEAARLREEAREQGAQIIAEMREQAQAEARRDHRVGPGPDPGRAAAGADRAAEPRSGRWRRSWPAGSWASRSPTRRGRAGWWTGSSTSSRWPASEAGNRSRGSHPARSGRKSVWTPRR